jgi:glutamyl-tRNA synthetase
MAADPPLRLRIAPAPSGSLHVGNLRTALYNWLHARGHDGTFILRIEDTDERRATDEGMRGVIDALRWAGLDWDEGPNVGGRHGPYVQSDRRELHQAVVRRLLDAGEAYEDHATAEELEAWRRTERDAGRAPILKGPLRAEPRPGETDPPSIRLRTPVSGEVVIDDLVRGQVTFDWASIGDLVIQRADASPTYPLANAVDDLAQGVSLVCRGEDLLSVTPRQVRLYEVLETDGLLDDALEEAKHTPRGDGWGDPRRFAHLPLVVGEDRKPLSKRHGSVAVEEFRRQGFLPEVLLNYLALLGWGSVDGRERLTVDELVAEFDLARVGRTAGAFDVDKLTAFNGERIRELSENELARRLIPFLDGTHGEALISSEPSEGELATLRGLVPLVQERMQRLDEVRTYAAAFLTEDVGIDPESVRKVLTKAGAVEALAAAAERLEALEEWDRTRIEEVLRAIVDDLELSVRKVFQPVRVAVTGSHVSPPLFESMELLGRETSLRRLRAAIPVAEAADSA